MAINPTTGIDTDVDRFVVYLPGESQSSNQYAAWPRFDGGPVEGGFNGQEWYKRVGKPAPPHDHRYTLQTEWAKVPADPPAEEGYPAGTFEPVFTVTKLPIEDLKTQVGTQFQEEVRRAIPATDLPSELAAQIDAIARKQDGAVLTPKQSEKRTKAKSTGDILTILEARRDALLLAIDNDEDYDITAGWAVA